MDFLNILLLLTIFDIANVISRSLQLWRKMLIKQYYSFIKYLYKYFATRKAITAILRFIHYNAIKCMLYIVNYEWEQSFIGASIIHYGKPCVTRNVCISKPYFRAYRLWSFEVKQYLLQCKCAWVRAFYQRDSGLWFYSAR